MRQRDEPALNAPSPLQDKSKPKGRTQTQTEFACPPSSFEERRTCQCLSRGDSGGGCSFRALASLTVRHPSVRCWGTPDTPGQGQGTAQGKASPSTSWENHREQRAMTCRHGLQHHPPFLVTKLQPGLSCPCPGSSSISKSQGFLPPKDIRSPPVPFSSLVHLLFRQRLGQGAPSLHSLSHGVTAACQTRAGNAEAPG